VIDAVVLAETADVETVTLAEVDPAGTTRLAGTVAAALLLDSTTFAPPAGAGPLNVRVAVDVLPALTLVGTNTTVNRWGLIMLTEVLAWPPAPVAVRVVTVRTGTGEVCTPNVTVLVPPGTTTELGTPKEGELLDSEIVVPPDPAGPDRKTLPVALAPPISDEGVTETEFRPTTCSNWVVITAVLLSVPYCELAPNSAQPT
jgi:hypothetical protein